MPAFPVTWRYSVARLGGLVGRGDPAGVRDRRNLRDAGDRVNEGLRQAGSLTELELRTENVRSAELFCRSSRRPSADDWPTRIRRCSPGSTRNWRTRWA